MKRIITLLFLLISSYSFADFEEGTCCCAKNCDAGKFSRPFKNAYPDSKVNESYCKGYVKAVCGGEGYSCDSDSCDWSD